MGESSAQPQWSLPGREIEVGCVKPLIVAISDQHNSCMAILTPQ